MTTTIASTAAHASPPGDFADLRRLLSERAASLSPRLRDCARFALQEPDRMALATVYEIASAAGVQPSTLVRFAQALGYSGFSDLQQVFQGRLTGRRQDYTRRPTDLRSQGETSASSLLTGFIDAAHGYLERLHQEIDPGSLDSVVSVLAGARRIELLGLRRSFPVAAYLHYSFGKMGVHATLLDAVGGVLADRARYLGGQDVLLVISFAPYAPESLEYAHQVAERNVPVVALTDNAISPLAEVADWILEVSDAELSGFRTLSATICLATALAVAVGETRTAGAVGLNTPEKET